MFVMDLMPQISATRKGNLGITWPIYWSKPEEPRSIIWPMSRCRSCSVAAPKKCAAPVATPKPRTNSESGRNCTKSSDLAVFLLYHNYTIIIIIMVYLHNHTSIIIIIPLWLINYTMDNLIKIIPPWFVSPSAILGHDVFINRSFGCVEVGRCMDREHAIWMVWRIVEPSWVIQPFTTVLRCLTQLCIWTAKSSKCQKVPCAKPYCFFKILKDYESMSFRTVSEARHKSNTFVSQTVTPLV